MQDGFTIIVLGYKRLYSIQRLFISLLEAAKPYEKTEPLNLIFSLDADGDMETEHFCRNVFSRHFHIKIVVHEKHLGPDKHNLWAMQESESLGAVMVLEDDTMVSSSLFFYAIQAFDFYKNNEEVAGISLYNYERNEACHYPFYKIKDGFDNYFYMKASSRGYLISKEQWLNFKNRKTNTSVADIPKQYQEWNDDIWEKQFNIYLIQTNRYWVFPSISFSTNFGEPGAHVNKNIYRHAFQSPMLQGIQKKFNFSELSFSNAVYDSHGEAVKIDGFKEGEITADVFGERDLSKIKTKYILTSRNCTKNIESYALDLVPPELNLTHNLKGTDLKVTEPQFIHENYFMKLKRLLRLHYYFYPDKGLLHLLRLKISEILTR